MLLSFDTWKFDYFYNVPNVPYLEDVFAEVETEIGRLEVQLDEVGGEVTVHLHLHHILVPRAKNYPSIINLIWTNVC